MPDLYISEQVIEVFGIIAITIMVVSYGLEKRATAFILIFAIGCAMAAVYAYLLGSYPFLLAESIWCVIAFKRWQQHRIKCH